MKFCIKLIITNYNCIIIKILFQRFYISFIRDFTYFI